MMAFRTHDGGWVTEWRLIDSSDPYARWSFSRMMYVGSFPPFWLALESRFPSSFYIHISLRDNHTLFDEKGGASLLVYLFVDLVLPYERLLDPSKTLSLGSCKFIC